MCVRFSEYGMVVYVCMSMDRTCDPSVGYVSLVCDVCKWRGPVCLHIYIYMYGRASEPAVASSEYRGWLVEFF